MNSLIVAKLWQREVLAQYEANITLASLGKNKCYTCNRLVAADRFWNKTTCRACYVGARQ